MPTARDKALALAGRITHRTQLFIGLEDANTLRRAELTLQRWQELGCGTGDGRALERDESTGKPYMYNSNTGRRTPTADREAGAIRRVREVCDRLGLHFYYQPDPRGCTLYVAAEPLTDQTYTRGVACCD